MDPGDERWLPWSGRAQRSLGPNCLGTRWRGGYPHLLLPLITQVGGLGTSCPRKGELLCARHVSTTQRDSVSAAGPWAEWRGHETEEDTPWRQDRCARSALRPCSPQSAATSRADSRNFISSSICKSGEENVPLSSACPQHFDVPLASQSSFRVFSGLGFLF